MEVKGVGWQMRKNSPIWQIAKLREQYRHLPTLEATTNSQLAAAAPHTPSPQRPWSSRTRRWTVDRSRERPEMMLSIMFLTQSKKWMEDTVIFLFHFLSWERSGWDLRKRPRSSCNNPWNSTGRCALFTLSHSSLFGWNYFSHFSLKVLVWSTLSHLRKLAHRPCLSLGTHADRPETLALTEGRQTGGVGGEVDLKRIFHRFGIVPNYRILLS